MSEFTMSHGIDGEDNERSSVHCSRRTSENSVKRFCQSDAVESRHRTPNFDGGVRGEPGTGESAGSATRYAIQHRIQ